MWNCIFFGFSALLCFVSSFFFFHSLPFYLPFTFVLFIVSISYVRKWYKLKNSEWNQQLAIQGERKMQHKVFNETFMVAWFSVKMCILHIHELHSRSQREKCSLFMRLRLRWKDTSYHISWMAVEYKERQKEREMEGRAHFYT